jgi:nucleotide-binding universal stress UspA family protein
MLMYEKVLVTMDGSEQSEIVLPYIKEFAEYFDTRFYVIGVYSLQNDPFVRLFGGYLKDLVRRLNHIGIKAEAIFRQGKVVDEIVKYSSSDKFDLIILAAHGRSGTGGLSVGHIAESIIRGVKQPVLIIPRKVEEKKEEQALLRNIMVPLDGSEAGEHALEAAVALARKMGVKLHVLHIMMPFDFITGGMEYALKLQRQLMDILHTQAKEYLDNIEKKLSGENLEVKFNLLEGLPVEVILNYIRNNSIDLVTMSSHGLTALEHFVLGSVTDKVLHASPIPVLIVHVPKVQK